MQVKLRFVGQQEYCGLHNELIELHEASCQACRWDEMMESCERWVEREGKAYQAQLAVELLRQDGLASRLVTEE